MNIEMNFFGNKICHKISGLWVLVTLFLGVSQVANAAATLTADESSTCEGYPIVLKAQGFAAGTRAADLYKSTDGGSTWKIVQSAGDPSGVFTFVDDMGSTAVMYYAAAQITKEKSGTISISLSTECTAACHTTSSGDYYLGTDFDPESGYRPSDIQWSTVPPTNLSSHFEANKINFKANCDNGQDVENWTYSDGVQPSVDRLTAKDSDGDGLPDDWEVKKGLNPENAADAQLTVPNTSKTYLQLYKEEKGSNYYYVFSGCNQPFELQFDGDTYRNKFYRFTMKMYVDLSGCSSSDREQIAYAMMNFRTQYGNDSYNAVEINMYDDATNRLLAEKPFESKGQLPANQVGDVFRDNPSTNKFRMEVTMYGQFTGSQTTFGVIPEFQQWRSCAKIAVDYISADVESVCMEHGAVCVGQSTVINAAGFPRNSVYKWEVDETGTGNWSVVQIGGFDMVGTQYQKINLPVDFVGTRKYRVTGTSTLMGESVQTSVTFNVTGKNCEPLQPTEIDGPVIPFCVPNSKESGRFSVSPMDANQSVTYSWSFKTPSGEEFGSDKISFSGGELDVDTRGGSIYLLLDGNAEEGEYTVTVRPVKTVVQSDGAHKVPAGEPISKTFTVYRTPRIRIIKEGTDPLNQDAVEICPTDDQQKFVAIADPVAGFSSIYMNQYVYNWTSGATGVKDIADIVITPEICTGVTAEHTAQVTVQIADVGCPATVDQSWRYGRHDAPTINCNSLSARNINLSATESKKTISLLPLPSYKVGCESNPRIKVNLVFTPDAGTKIEKEISIREKDLATTDFNVTLPAGKGTITYTVADGCGLEATCSIPVTIKDVTPPNIDCSAINSYTAHLKYQDGRCSALPGYYTDLPTLEAPVLEDKNGVDGTITGQYLGRLMSASTPAYANEAQRALFKKTIELNANYEVGDTYILWAFEDASHNVSYCLQKITVIDDVPPTVVCPDFSAVSNVDNQAGECGLSVNGLLAWLTNNGYSVPSATDVCSGEGDEIIPELYYNAAGKTPVLIAQDAYNDIIFNVNTKYILTWRFWKKNRETYSDCVLEFTVRDTEAPVFDCTSLQIVRVTSNIYKPLNETAEYLDYASKNDVKVGAVTYTGTLAEPFANGDIKFPSLADVKDNCSGDVTIAGLLEGPDETGETQTIKITSTSDLERVKYGIGLTTITYTFTDKEGNASECTQNIVVTSGTTPKPNCDYSRDTLYVNDNCLATLLIKKEDMPTANIPVNRTGVYFNFRYNIISGLSFKGCEDVSKYFPDKLYDLKNKVNSGNTSFMEFSLDPKAQQYYRDKTTGVLTPGAADPGPNGTWIYKYMPELTPENICTLSADLNQLILNDVDHNDWFYYQKVTTTSFGWMTNTSYSAGIKEPGKNKIFSVSNSLTQPMDTIGYPYKITLETMDGTVIEEVLNPYEDDETVPTRLVVPRYYGSSGTNAEPCMDEALVCETEDVKIHNNFPATVLNVTDLTKGEYMVKYHFQDKKGGKQLAYCYRQITVIDTVAPKVECGDWSNEGTFKANADCRKPANEVSWFKKPTPEQLKVKDNCTASYDDFTITWKRVFKSIEDISDKALTDPFLMDTTYMYWYIADQSGNKTFCKQTIIVNDSTGPEFDCSILKPITAYADKDCKVDSSVVADEGLVVPVAKDDACSPTGGDIKGVGTRSDGKPMSAPYELANSPITITWTFTDAAGMSTVCEQVVTIVDTIQPVFDCKAIRDTFIDLDPTQCVATTAMVKAALGTHNAEDNCSGTVPGVPHVLLADNTLADLYAEFKKDTTYTIVWTFTDDAGVVKECSQQLAINDTTPPDPSGVCPPPTKNVDATTTCSVNYSDLGLPTEESLKINDLCDGEIIPELVARVTQYDGSIISYRGSEAYSATYPVGTHQFYWIYTDKAENKDTCKMQLTVTDKIKPVMEDCDVEVEVGLTVSDTLCAIDPAQVKALIVEPKAYDECDDLSSGAGLTYLVPVVKRYKIDSTSIVDEQGIRFVYDTVLVADGVTKMWDEDMFPKGLTKLTWIFTDKAGNQDSCSKNVIVYDHTPPYFDCNNIDPDTLRPEAPKGQCEYEFKLLKEEILSGLNYKAYDACAGDSIPGVLTLNGIMELPDEYTMKVGILYQLLWMFKDEDGNATTCPQWILPSHLNPIDVDCDQWPDTLSFVAEAGTCEANQDSIVKNIEFPSVKDACELGTIVAVPTFITPTDTIEIDLQTQKFYTGDTTIYWRFVSPWNLHDTAWCHQVVHVAGNKQFDIDCETLTPTILDTIADCGPATSTIAKIKVPEVPDPCADPDSPEYMRKGVGTRSDSTATTPLSVFNDPYPLGPTSIQWVFTDFTGVVKDTCTQEIFVRTTEEIKLNCDSLNHDTIKAAYDVPDGVCTVAHDLILDPDTLTYPEAHHPCLDTVKIRVYPRRANGKAWTDDYIVGVNLIEWIFIDDTHTTINDSVMCTQPIQVGENSASLFDCKNIPNKRVELTADDCTIDAATLDFTKDVPSAFDACGIYAGQEVVPTWKRTSGKGMDDLFTVGKDTIVWTFHYNSIDDDIVCEQEIHVLDSKEPLFDCDLLKDTVMKSEPGLCYLNQKAILNLLDSLKNTHYATDACDPTFKIQGVYNESVVPTVLNVGDTINVHWVFQDTTINLSKKECDQMITVIGDKAPIIDCDTLSHDTLLIQGCDTTLSSQTIKTPVALDACTNDSIPGVGERTDGGELYGVYPVGTTTIHWTFISPFSTETTSCDQQITILTEKEIDFDCESLADTTFNVAEGECSTVVTLPGQVGYHPCPVQSGVTEIIGIPTSNGTAFTANADSTEWTMTLPTGVWEIKWTFTDSSNTMANPIKVCSQKVTVGDVNEMPVDCKNYPDTIIGLTPGDCEISWSAINFNAPQVVDLCSGEVIAPVLTRWSGKNMDESFTVGIDTVYWNYSFAGQEIMCRQMIQVKDSIEPTFDCDNLKDVELTAPLGKCELSPEALVDSLGQWNATDVCSGTLIPGKAFVEGVAISEVTLHVGDTVNVHWIFKNDTINAVAKECDQQVTVVGQNQPQFDCASLLDSIFYLRQDECSLPGDRAVLGIPVAKDSCTGVDVPGVPTRADGLTMTDKYQKGTTVITWLFKSPVSITPKECPQNVIVKDTIKPVVKCEELADTVYFELVDNTELTYTELVNQGFTVPTVVDFCDGVITAVGTREDGKAMEDNYPVGATNIVWTYTDLSNNSDTCHQVIYVEDLIDTLYCPKNFNGLTVTCLDTFPVYSTLDEFFAAGGHFSNHSKVQAGSFRVTETFTGKEFCDETYYRTYHVLDAKNRDIFCTDTVYVKDNIAPQFNSTLAPDEIKTCTDEIPALASVTATDNCDPNPTVSTNETNSRGSDPTKCDYYTYEIVRTFKAIDRCENKTEYTQKISVVDTIGPKFERPANWKDTVLASNLKKCMFGTPDFTTDMAQWVKDDCTDNLGITIKQNPAAGSVISTTTVVWITMTDLCNNRDSVSKVVKVQDPKTIVSLAAYSTDSCVSSENPLMISSQQMRFANGKVEVTLSNGTIRKVDSQFSYDYYKGDRSQISDANLLYSDNKLTHADMVEYYKQNGGLSYFQVLNTSLTRRSQSGYYSYVAMDTITGCSDTATAELKLNEVPRISMASGMESICELNTLDSAVFQSYVNCVNPMGRAILDEGWLSNDTIISLGVDTFYIEQNNSRLVYYATNSCGTSTSLNTLVEFCSAEPQTKEDSLAFVGGDVEKYNALKADNYVTKDSILLDIHKRYDPSNIKITTEPHDPARIWLGEIVELNVHTDYQYQSLTWHKVVGEYDRNRVLGIVEHEDFVYLPDTTDEGEDEVLSYVLSGEDVSLVDAPQDTARYYVTITDGVCPSVASDLAQVNVILKLPTAFTPYQREGLNDIFMERHSIVIFDRYSQKVFEGDNGWDGTKGGKMADPGVYFYVVVMTDGSIRKGTIEIVFLNND